MSLFDALPNAAFYAKDTEPTHPVNARFFPLHCAKYEADMLSRDDRAFHPLAMWTDLADAVASSGVIAAHHRRIGSIPPCDGDQSRGMPLKRSAPAATCLHSITCNFGNPGDVHPRTEVFSAVGKSAGSAWVTAPVAAHSAPRWKLAINPAQFIGGPTAASLAPTWPKVV
jgi:hypothetical protein